MSHEVETMFYENSATNNRFVPWHGLGTPVETALTSKDALKMAGLDWKVNPLPIYNHITTEDKDVFVEVPGYQMNVRDKDNSVLGVVSNKYKILQNDEAFDFTDNLIGEKNKVYYETAGSLKEGRTIWLLAKLPEAKVVGDAVIPYVCFTNSHDGTGAVRACLTNIRVCCNNTLNMALEKAPRSWSTKHMGNINDKLVEAERCLELAYKYTNELDVMAQRWANVDLPETEVMQIIDELYPVKDTDTDRKKQNIQNFKNQYQVCYLAPDIVKFANSAWRAINAMSDFVTHSEPNRNTQSFQENRFAKILNGHPLMDAFMEKVSERRGV